MNTFGKQTDRPLSQKSQPEDLTQGGTYSNGTGALQMQLEAHIKSFNCKTDTILINLGTLLRNRLGKIGDKFERGTPNYNKMLQTSSATMIKEVATELQSFVKSIWAAYHTTQIDKPYILFYCPAYERILPKEILREANGQRLMLQMAVDGMINEIHKSKLNRDVKVEGLTIRYLPMVDRTSIPRSLVYIVRSLKNRQQVLMVSHQAIDWHICDVFKTMVLLESHTGNYKHPDQFAQKAFGMDDVPFMPATHAILGDKSLIEPVISGKDKEKLIQMSLDQNWGMRTSEYVADRIRAMGWVKPNIESYFKAR